MTNTNKSAADVLKIAYEIINLVRQNYYYNSPSYLVNQTVVPLINQAIQAQTKAYAAENLELRAEIEKLKITVKDYGAAQNWQRWPDQLCPHWECLLGPGPARVALSQPTPTGSGEWFLKALVNLAKFSPKTLYTYSTLTPEDIKLLEGYGNA